jgi:hypothetical protein
VSSDDGWVTEHPHVGGSTIHCRRSRAGTAWSRTSRGYGHSERRAHVLNIPELAEVLMALLAQLDDAIVDPQNGMARNGDEY